MNPKEILEGNKLIAEFIGLAYCTKQLYEGWYQNSEFNHRICGFNGLKYHTSWEWLMPVISKIQAKGFYTAMEYFNISDNSSFKIGNTSKDILFSNCKCETERMTCYKTIIEFITWYNQNKNL